MIPTKNILFQQYLSFLDDLDFLLKQSGIMRNRLPVSADLNDTKNWQESDDHIHQQKIGKIVQYIDEHLDEELSLQELAEKIDLSKYQLIRGFRKEEGTTPWKFLLYKRIENVKKLLEEGMASGQAAVESGFYDQSHLNKVFRKSTGQTPKQYQEENFKNKNLALSKR